jgi:hypothetical protein
MGVKIGLSPTWESQILREIWRRVMRRVFRPEIRELKKITW